MESKPPVHHPSYPPSGPPPPTGPHPPSSVPVPPHPSAGTPYMNGGSPLPSNAPPPSQRKLSLHEYIRPFYLNFFYIVASTRGPGVNPVKSGAGPLINSSSTSEALGDINPENVPANMKVEGQDWFAL